MKYSKRVSVNLPKLLLDELDRVLLVDGRHRAEVIRTLIVNFIREEKGASRSTTGGAARSTTR